MVDRTPREQKTRESSARKKTWVRPSALPTPAPKDGMKFRWVRTSTIGNADTTNVSARFREGYVPVKAADHPELQLMTDQGSRFPDGVEVGGLLLCAIDEEISDDRVAQQTEMTQRQMEAVDNNYMRQSDPRMPMLRPERSTRTSFGET